MKMRTKAVQQQRKLRMGCGERLAADGLRRVAWDKTMSVRAHHAKSMGVGK